MIEVGARINDVKAKFAQVTGLAGNMVSGIRSKLSGIAGGILGAFSVGVAVAKTKELANEMDKLAKSARRAGMEKVEFGDWQKLVYAAKQGGASLESVESAFKKMSRTIDDAGDGSAEAVRTLGKLGVTLADLQGKSQSQRFDLIAVALANIKDKGEQAALAQEVFGRGGTALTQILETYKATGAKLEELGGVMGGETLEAAERFNDAMQDIGTNIKGMVAGSGLIEWLASIAEGLRDAYALAGKLKANDAKNVHKSYTDNWAGINDRLMESGAMRWLTGQKEGWWHGNAPDYELHQSDTEKEKDRKYYTEKAKKVTGKETKTTEEAKAALADYAKTPAAQADVNVAADTPQAKKDEAAAEQAKREKVKQDTKDADINAARAKAKDAIADALETSNKQLGIAPAPVAPAQNPQGATPTAPATVVGSQTSQPTTPTASQPAPSPVADIDAKLAALARVKAENDKAAAEGSEISYWGSDKGTTGGNVRESGVSIPGFDLGTPAATTAIDDRKKELEDQRKQAVNPGAYKVDQIEQKIKVAPELEKDALRDQLAAAQLEYSKTSVVIPVELQAKLDTAKTGEEFKAAQKAIIDYSQTETDKKKESGKQSKDYTKKKEDFAADYAKTIAQLKQQAGVQELLNKGKEREAAIQEALNAARNDAKSQGQTLTADQEKEIGGGAGKLFDLQQQQNFAGERRIEYNQDSLSRVGGYTGSMSSGVATGQDKVVGAVNSLKDILNKVDTRVANITGKIGKGDAKWPA